MTAALPSLSRNCAPLESGYVVTSRSAYAEAHFRRNVMVLPSAEEAFAHPLAQSGVMKVYRCERKTNHDGVIVVATEIHSPKA